MVTAFAISSFYAGVAGALLGSVFGRLIPETWNLLLSVEFIAIILIGGAGTITGTLLGTMFVVTLPRFVDDFTLWLANQAETGGAFSSSRPAPTTSDSSPPARRDPA